MHNGSVSNVSQKASFKQMNMVKFHVLKEGLQICHVRQLLEVGFTSLPNTQGSRRGREGKDVAVTGREGPQGCEMLMLPHFLDNWLTDGSKVVSLTCWPPFTP
jgi:hypothetical protein